MKPFTQLRLHSFDGCQSESAEESGARFKLGATENKFGRYRQAELRRNESNRQRRRSPRHIGNCASSITGGLRGLYRKASSADWNDG